MAQQACKKIYQENRKIRRSISLSIIITSTLYFLLIFHLKRSLSSELFGFLLKSLPEFSAYFYLMKASKPVLQDNKLVRVGSDLNSRGVFGVLFDVMYICMFVKIASIFSKLFYLCYGLILVCGWYEFVYRFQKRIRNQ
ncbi:hypothetical protein EDEG_01058 [Edhazardia aedis USNM 41457]|uniref:DUF788 domain-containing protein n=1 Tax=Edhazardia aedis (strain USNM 41457) TaxID=1003232 RepID=J8ZYL9_EDHAE|nr:hypothetical protein EDEG_01058 [Edhazardia aedis USNM 41457]|eukprot:EJW04768.1 hypothetical protein EDEG_01058 [Edhazardia aedis USNM 41457]